MPTADRRIGIQLAASTPAGDIAAVADRVVLVPNPGGHYCNTTEIVEQIRIASKLAAMGSNPVPTA